VFDWITWRACDIFAREQFRCRSDDLVAKAAFLRKHAIGYCPGESLVCRPKTEHVGVMLVIDDVPMWFHMRNSEFGAIFK
jgi:hypothetical protein